MTSFRDPVFPALSNVLDVELMRDLLCSRLARDENPWQLSELKIYQVQYEPRRRCSILYSGRFVQRDTNRTTKQLLSAALAPPHESAVALAPDLVMRYEALPKRIALPPVVRLDDMRLAIHPFPLDPMLPTLVQACDQKFVRQELRDLWKARGVRAPRVRVERLGYTPGARVALGFDVRMNMREGAPCPPRFVGKIDAEKGAADLFARSWAVRRAAAGSFNVVPPVDYIPTLDMYLQEWLVGARLTDAAGTPDFLEWVRQTARAAAALHGLDVPVRSRRTAEKEARTVHRHGQALAAIRPAQARRVRDLRDRIAAELERRVTITGIVHADLHPANIIVNTDGITVIDLDNLALGDRGLDVGRFLSALRTSALRTYGDVSALKHAGQAFLETYLKLTNEDEYRLRLFEAASLMITAMTGFRLQRAGWEEAADALLWECERALQQALVNRTRTRRPPDAPRCADGKRWALEPEYMRSVLSSLVRREYRAELTNCRVREGRASPRAQRIRYDLAGQRGGQPWRASFDGILWQRGSGRGPTRRVQAVASALGDDKALLIPRPVASLTSIGLQLVERPTGAALSSLFSGETGAHLAVRLAQGLVALHNTAVDLDKCQTLDQESESLRRSVERAAGVSERDGSAVAALLETIEKRLSAVTESHRPVLRRLPLNQLLWTGERIVIASVDDVVLSHPLLDVADVLARMRWMQSVAGCGESFVNAASCLRETYLANAGGGCSDLALFEAAALLRLACGRAKLSRSLGADELLQSAAELLLQDEMSEVDAHG